MHNRISFPRPCHATAAFVTLLAVGAALASRTLPPLPPPAFADTEVSTNCPIGRIGPDTTHFEFSLVVAATPSNNVEAAFGTDANANGVLDFGEESLAIGWDCGAWFAGSPPGGSPRLEESAIPGAKTLSFSLLRSSGGPTRSLSVLDGTNAVLHALADDPPSWVFDPTWNLLRLTARGVDSPDERFTVRFAPDGNLFIFR